MLLLGILLKIRTCKRFQKDLEENQGTNIHSISNGAREDRENVTDKLLLHVLGCFRNTVGHFSTKIQGCR